MSSSGKGKGSVKTIEWWKHLRKRKRAQNKLVRKDGKKKALEGNLSERSERRMLWLIIFLHWR